MVGLVHGVIADEVAELLALNGAEVEDERVVELYGSLTHDLAQCDKACGKEAVGIDGIAIEPLAQAAVTVEQSLGALEVFVALVWVDDDGYNLDIGHGLAVLVDRAHTSRREHDQRLEHPRPGATYCK